jgi:hypothetical protein
VANTVRNFVAKKASGIAVQKDIEQAVAVGIENQWGRENAAGLVRARAYATRGICDTELAGFWGGEGNLGKHAGLIIENVKMSPLARGWTAAGRDAI